MAGLFGAISTFSTILLISERVVPWNAAASVVPNGEESDILYENRETRTDLEAPKRAKNYQNRSKKRRNEATRDFEA